MRPFPATPCLPRAVGPEYYVTIMSFVDKTQLEPGSTVLLHNKVRAGGGPGGRAASEQAGGQARHTHGSGQGRVWS